MEKVTFTHYGKFGLCPVLFANIDSEAPVVDPRYWWLEPFLLLNEFFMGLYFELRMRKDPSYEPMFPLLVKGELAKPIVR